jgi:molecular chaperone HscB
VLDFSRNHFELFGLPVGFALDRELLAERFRALQDAVHPDRFARASDQERRLSMQASTRVNEGFQVLKDPLQRALYLLGLHPDPSAEAVPQDPGFLMEQMELRETLADAQPLAPVGEELGDVGRGGRGHGDAHGVTGPASWRNR